MAYLVFARKWRPKKFSQVVGQDHAVKALTHALANDRVHHAYLLSGTRGVGKTTLGRLLAKALNCPNCVDGDPCGECDVCLDIETGRYVDLIEVDAASRTKVEDTRELLENCNYAPSRGTYKVYLIDEIHMLSGHSFNALLKTLEEPPAHVRFVLATTDPQKIPVTILSRCLQFNLKRLSVEQIAAHMAKVLHAEHLEFEAAAIRQLAFAADGSLRDGLSLLDQAVAYGRGQVTAQDVTLMLGRAPRQVLFAIIESLITRDSAALFGAVEELASAAPDYGDALAQFANILHTIALSQVVPEIGQRDPDAEEIMRYAALMRPDDVQFFYQVAITGRRDLPLAPDQRGGFEMTLLRILAFQQNVVVIPRDGEEPAQSTIARAPANVSSSAAAVNWSDVVKRMALPGMAGQLAGHCVLKSVNEQECRVTLASQFSNLRTPRVLDSMEKALQNHFRKPSLRLIVEIDTDGISANDTPAAIDARASAERQSAAMERLRQDETVLALKEQLAAELLPDSVQALN